MKIVVFGATGKTGKQIISQALSAGYKVTAYVRSPERLGEWRSKVNVVQGDINDLSKINEAIKGQDAVFFALGYSKIRDKSQIFTRATRNILEAMKVHGVKKLIYESAYGVAESRKDANPILGFIFFDLVLKYPYADHAQAESLIKESGVQWTIARPGRLTDGPLKGHYKTENRLKGMRIVISRADVAHFMLRSLSDSQFQNRTVGLSY